MLRKGREHNKEGYMNWASAYRFVTNPLIVYTDSKDFYKFMMKAYSATQHAKYALVSNAIRDKHFENEFYAWIDIGYFRNGVKYNNFIQLLAPPDIDKNKIAVNQVLNYTKGLSPSTIFRQSKVWVAGGMFIGTANLILQFEQLYKRAINYFLDKKNNDY